MLAGLLLPALIAGCAGLGGPASTEPELSQSRSDITESGEGRNRARRFR